MLTDLDGYLPLDLRPPPGAFTGWRIRLAAKEPEVCYATLVRSDIPAEQSPRRLVRDGCGYDDAVALSGESRAASPPMRCGLALAYAAWERHVVAPAALRRLGSPVVSIRTLGAFACRDIAGSAGRRSQHATANAVDVAGFTLKDGRTVSVAGDWKGDDTKGLFLREVRDGACGLFSAVLSPDSNAAHRDHLHLDLGPARVCR
ncbi:extensin-like domain-containing protein [Chelatococcus sambhunathii]|uniref:extensin-like domain-containing protein n=1 Tax=Chelatococcus sambhunathii TaxID=363953 RepID=UPI002852835A|nr:extensin family protein [Chelatococcus sambhunathii]